METSLHPSVPIASAGCPVGIVLDSDPTAQTHSYPLPSCGGALTSGIKVGAQGRRIIGEGQGESEGEAARITVSGPSGVTTVSPPDLEMWEHELLLWVPNLHGPERARTEVEAKMG